MNLGTMDNLDATSESKPKKMKSCLHRKKVLFNHVGYRTRHQKKCKIRPNSSAWEVPSKTEITFLSVQTDGVTTHTHEKTTCLDMFQHANKRVTI